MDRDPLFEAIRLGLPTTSVVLGEAIRHRQAKIQELQWEVNVLSFLSWQDPSAREVRQERDPPIETPERTYH